MSSRTASKTASRRTVGRTQGTTAGRTASKTTGRTASRTVGRTGGKTTSATVGRTADRTTTRTAGGMASISLQDHIVFSVFSGRNVDVWCGNTRFPVRHKVSFTARTIVRYHERRCKWHLLCWEAGSCQDHASPCTHSSRKQTKGLRGLRRWLFNKTCGNMRWTPLPGATAGQCLGDKQYVGWMSEAYLH